MTARIPIAKRLRRLKTLPVLPTLLTAGNLASGITAILCAAHDMLLIGAIMVFVAMVCDMLDGKVARITGTDGAFGAELDSLSDVVSFGVAPAILVHRLVLEKAGVFLPGERLLWFVTVFYPVMAAIRLARYNVEKSDEATPYFRGLPSPGAAALVCSLIIVYQDQECHAWLQHFGLLQRAGTVSIFGWMMVAASMAAALLMVSTVRFPHFGNTLLGRLSFRKLIVLLLMVSFLVWNYAIALAVTTSGYLLFGVVGGVIDMWRQWRQGRSPLDDIEADGADDAGLGLVKPDADGPAPGR